ncbi:MAG: hypothetical protein ACREE0_06960 [Phenylobacterium sp.]
MHSHRNFAAKAVGLLTAATLLTAPQAALAAGKSASIEGAWTVTDVVVTGANPTTNPSPQPSIYIFSHGHYSQTADTGRTLRAGVTVKDPANPTDAEKVAKYQEWGPVIAQAGTYELKGTTLIRHPIVAKNVAAIGPGGQSESEIKLTGDTLVMISHAAAGQPAREQRLTLTRAK